MIHEISDKLGIQLIIVTHEEALKECADRTFVVKFENGSSNVQRIGDGT